MGRLIGVDHGTRRVGVAVGDSETGMAFPRPAVLAGDGALDAILELARDESAERVVVGLPLNMDGSEGRQAGLARAFGARLQARGMEVAYCDERLTSWQASERRAQAGQRQIGADSIDSAAAALILEQYFADHRRHPEEP